MCKILRSRLYIIVNRFKDRGENMEDNKLLRLLHKDPNAGMEQLMNQYTGLVYSNATQLGSVSAIVKVMGKRLPEGFCFPSLPEGFLDAIQPVKVASSITRVNVIASIRFIWVPPF